MLMPNHILNTKISQFHRSCTIEDIHKHKTYPFFANSLSILSIWVIAIILIYKQRLIVYYHFISVLLKCLNSLDKPITPQANLAPALPVFKDYSFPPLPRSSSCLWTTMDLPNTEFGP